MFSFLKRFRKGDSSSPKDAPVAESPAPADVPAPEQATPHTPAPAAPAPEARVPVDARDAAQRPAAEPDTEPAAPPAPAPAPAPASAPAPARAPSPAPAVATDTPPTSDARAAVSAPPPERTANGSTAASPPDDDAQTFEIIPPPPPEPAAKRSWLSRLKSGLSKTSSSLTGIFVGVKVDEALFEELETALLMADAGVDATMYLLDALRQKVRTERLTDAQQVKAALRSLLVELLQPLERSMVLGRAQPLVMMIAGVNGAGKTTSIGKLAKHLQSFGQSVMLAAGDTFRAAAREQLAIWGERNNVSVIQQEGGDPAAVIFDAVSAARARRIDVLMADTAGRLPTQLHLMEELRKVKRVIGKAMDGAPHEVLLVLDANTGQNALAQVKAFDDALGLTGLIVTKLDGTAKGGILAAIARQRPVPVYFIGVGEKLEDLQPFVAAEFADALLG